MNTLLWQENLNMLAAQVYAMKLIMSLSCLDAPWLSSKAQVHVARHQQQLWDTRSRLIKSALAVMSPGKPTMKSCIK